MAIRKWMLMLVAITLMVVPLAACGDDVEVATDELTNPDATLTAQGEVPQNIEEAEITIQNGEMDAGQLVLSEDHSVVLMVSNEDDTAYRLQIVEGLVGEQELPAGETTRIEFTTLSAGEYEARLLSADTDDVLHTIGVRVQSAAGIDT